MAILTDLMIEIDSDYDNPKYGVSKTLNNYTLNDIWNNAYVGANFPVHRMISKSTGTGARYWSTDTTRPYTIGSLIYQWGQYIGARISASGSADDDEYKDDGVYTKTIWLYSSTSLPQTITNLASVRMVTQMDFTRLRLDFERSTGQSNGEGAPSWGDTKSYGTVKSCSYLLDNTDPNNPVWKTSGNITLLKPYQMIKVDDKICIIDALTTGYYANYLGGYEADTPAELVTGFSTVDGSVKFGLLQSLKKTSDSYGEIRWYENSWSVNYPTMYDNYKAYMQNRTTSLGYNQTVIYPITQDEFQKNIMGYGVYFKTDRTYKPIIVDGYVTGYTNDLSTPSELDTYTASAMHDVPDVKPSGGGGGGNGDELLDMESRAQFYGSGITTYYVNVPTAKLKTALGNWDNIATGKDVLKNLISYKLFCFPTSTFTNGMLHDFVIAGTTLKDENNNNIQSSQLTQYGAVSLPSITIPKTFNDFRDYAPYTNLSMYIPLCGWFTLPPWCMGRTISGEMYINGYTGTLKCIVRADGNVVTELGGNASIDLPFAAEAVGMKAAAVLGNLINTAGSIASIANPSAGGVANVGTAVLGTVCALNANYTESKGTMGDGSNIAGLYHVYIKISRPATIDNEGNSLVTIPAEYKRQYGLPCNKSLTLTQGDGYTQILDANITGNMTAREKQMIIDGFRRGLIL